MNDVRTGDVVVASGEVVSVTAGQAVVRFTTLEGYHNSSRIDSRSVYRIKDPGELLEVTEELVMVLSNLVNTPDYQLNTVMVDSLLKKTYTLLPELRNMVPPTRELVGKAARVRLRSDSDKIYIAEVCEFGGEYYWAGSWGGLNIYEALEVVKWIDG